jgi:hypothetical protein
MSWKRGARTVGSSGIGCLNHLLMWTFVAPGLALLIALAELTGDPAWMVGAVVVTLLVFALYVLASWD